MNRRDKRRSRRAGRLTARDDRARAGGAVTAVGSLIRAVAAVRSVIGDTVGRR